MSSYVPSTRGNFANHTFLTLRFLLPSPPSTKDLKKFGNVQGGTQITKASTATFQQWHACLDQAMLPGARGEDIAKDLYPHVAPACKFHPPTYYTAWEGRDEFLLLIGSVSEVFGPSFSYGRQWLSDDGKDW